jgi:FkbM family methyltransferase
MDEKQLSALAARPLLKPGFRPSSIKGHIPPFRKLREENQYTGPVDVRIPGCGPFSMYCDADDNVAQTFFYYGEGAYEALSMILFAQLARRTTRVMDIGGHTGVFSLTAARANPACRVDYFDIVRAVKERAEVNVRISGLQDSIKLNLLGMSSQTGEMDAHVNANQALWTGASLESLPERVRQKGATTEKVSVSTIDEFWKENGHPEVGLIKLDVENHELEVFKGGQGMLSKHLPFMLCEVLSAQQFSAFQEALTKIGYKAFYEINDADLTMRAVLPGLKYEDGSPYEFKEYHNILVARNRLGPAFFETIAETLSRCSLGLAKLNPIWSGR